eukprot:8122434-Alexandrium_andersonii.AAC.1
MCIRDRTRSRPDDLRAAEEARRLASDPAQRRYWRRLAQRLRRKWQAERALHRASPKQRRPIRALCVDGVRTTDRQAWGQALLRHCSAKYVDMELTAVGVAQRRAWI